MSRAGVQGFQKERLKQMLAVRRLTQADLAAQIGVSPTTVSKWRSGDQVPERAALDRLSSVVGVTAEWFTRPLAPQISTPLFRSNASAHVAARAMLAGRLELAQEVALAFAEFVELVPLNLPSRDFSELDEITADEIEAAACECRDVWRLGRAAIQDLALAAESAGVVIVREETGVPQIEGLSAWSSAVGRPFVLLSADKDNGYRSRFDLAHELGHLVLHRKIGRTVDHELYKQMERQAHAFAGALLMPAETFAAEVRTPVTIDDLLLLKRRWGSSVAAIIKRLRALKIIDETGEQTLFKRRSARWGAKSEPGDGDREPEVPRVLRRTVQLLVGENVMPLEAIPRHIGLPARDVEMLAGLPRGYFDDKSTVQSLVRIRAESRGHAMPGGNVLPFRTPKS
jgi:Zn-dependent peptidase ImmA (M78 family)/DNA-binding XRE family transcriptional regulator